MLFVRACFKTTKMAARSLRGGQQPSWINAKILIVAYLGFMLALNGSTFDRSDSLANAPTPHWTSSRREMNFRQNSQGTGTADRSAADTMSARVPSVAPIMANQAQTDHPRTNKQEDRTNWPSTGSIGTMIASATTLMLLSWAPTTASVPALLIILSWAPDAATATSSESNDSADSCNDDTTPSPPGSTTSSDEASSDNTGEFRCQCLSSLERCFAAASVLAVLFTLGILGSTTTDLHWPCRSHH